MTHLLLIEQGAPGYRRYILERLQDQGIRCSLANCLQTTWDADRFAAIYTINYANWGKTVKPLKAAHERDPFDGVLCYTERSTAFANRIAHELGLAPISDSCSEWFRYKDQMRMAWETNHLRTPRYQILQEREDFYDLADWDFPLVLKPVAEGESDGVVKVSSYEELPEKVRIPFSVRNDFVIGDDLYFLDELYGTPNRVIAEEYIGGDEYSAEGIVVDGVYHLLGITKKFVGPEPYFEELGHLFPYHRFDPALKTLIVSELTRAHAALKLRYCFTHTEFKIWQGVPYLIELGARMGGDHIPRLVDRALGIHTVDLVASAACGVVPPALRDLPNMGNGRLCFVLFFTAPNSAQGAVYQGIDLQDFCQEAIVEFQEYLRPGDTILFSSEVRVPRLAHLIGQASSYEEACQLIEYIRKGVTIRYE